MTNELARLRRVCEIKYQRDLLQSQTINRGIQNNKELIARLYENFSTNNDMEILMGHPRQVAASSMWQQERASKINLELFALYAKKEMALDELRKTFGKLQAVKELETRTE